MKQILFTLACGLAMQSAAADQVIQENLIVRASACIGGADCTDGMDFLNNIHRDSLIVSGVGGSSILMQNRFDTSFNLTVFGGAFYIENETNRNVRVFGIDEDAKQDTLFIGPSGNIGLFTNTPVADVELSIFAESGSTAEMRLFDVSQSWDVELADNDDFQIQDVSAGTVPFSIEDRAPNDSLIIDASGQTNTKTINAIFDGMNSLGDGLSKVVALSANNSDLGKSSDVGFSIRNEKAGFLWNFRTFESSQGFVATKEGTGGPEFQIRNTTNDFRTMSILAGNGAELTIGGVWTDASSREYKENIQPVSLQEAMQALENIEPVQYHYKRDQSKELYLGFIAEDVPQLVSTQGRKNMAPMEVIAMLTKVVQHQQQQIQGQQKLLLDQREANEQQFRLNETLMNKMRSLEKLVKLNSMVAMQH